MEKEKSIERKLDTLTKLVAAIAEDITDIKDDVKKITDQLTAVDCKVAGINRRLDVEAMQRTDLKLPRRVHDLEEKVYGPGASQHPKQLPL